MKLQKISRDNTEYIARLIFSFMLLMQIHVQHAFIRNNEHPIESTSHTILATIVQNPDICIWDKIEALISYTNARAGILYCLSCLQSLVCYIH